MESGIIEDKIRATGVDCVTPEVGFVKLGDLCFNAFSGGNHALVVRVNIDMLLRMGREGREFVRDGILKGGELAVLHHFLELNSMRES